MYGSEIREEIGCQPKYMFKTRQSSVEDDLKKSGLVVVFEVSSDRVLRSFDTHSTILNHN